jgi:hypothetical protein
MPFDMEIEKKKNIKLAMGTAAPGMRGPALAAPWVFGGRDRGRKGKKELNDSVIISLFIIPDTNCGGLA